jgi:hypothetical protein
MKLTPHRCWPWPGGRVPGPGTEQRRDAEGAAALRDRVHAARDEAAGRAGRGGRAGQWGMTPEQARELNRIAIKAEALQDNFTDQGYKGLKISGQMDPTYIYNRARQIRPSCF